MCLSCVQYAFAARLEDGGVVAWGDENNGGYIPPAKVAAAAAAAAVVVGSSKVHPTGQGEHPPSVLGASRSFVAR